MLKLFEVKGFKNFKDKISIDFSDVREYKFNTECIKENLLGSIIIYGKNSVGKSNLGLAMFDIVSHLTNKNVTPKLYDYYLNSNSDTNEAEFHYVFRFGNNELDYLYRKDANQSILFESITINNILLMEYDYLLKSGSLDELKKLAPTLNWIYQGEGSVIKYFLNNSILDNNHPLRQLMWFVSNMLWFRSLNENRFIGYKEKSKDYFEFVFEDRTLKEFENFLKSAGVNDNLVVKTDVDSVKRLYFDTKTPLPFFGTASSGTLALYTFFYWYKTASDLSFIFIDEFDAYYHYELSESIVSMLEKTNKCQTILTSHNTNLLTNRIMRPDCYFILFENKLTSLANATERELREGHNLEKLYMSGEFDG